MLQIDFASTGLQDDDIQLTVAFPHHALDTAEILSDANIGDLKVRLRVMKLLPELRHPRTASCHPPHLVPTRHEQLCAGSTEAGGNHNVINGGFKFQVQKVQRDAA